MSQSTPRHGLTNCVDVCFNKEINVALQLMIYEGNLIHIILLSSFASPYFGDINLLSPTCQKRIFTCAFWHLQNFILNFEKVMLYQVAWRCKSSVSISLLIKYIMSHEIGIRFCCVLYCGYITSSWWIYVHLFIRDHLQCCFNDFGVIGKRLPAYQLRDHEDYE